MANSQNILINTVSSEFVTLENGDSLQVTRIKNRQYRVAPYFCIGRKGGTSYLDPIIKRKIYTERLDVTGIFLQLNPTALALFWKLVSLRDTKTNIVNLKQHGLSKSDKNRLKKFLSELLNYQLVCKIKRGYLLINPKAIIPDYSYYESVELRWNKLNIATQANSIKPKHTTSAESLESIEVLKLSLPTSGMMTTPIEIDDEEDEPVEPPTLGQKLELTL